MTYVAELVAEQLSIDPIHRVYRGISAEALAARLALVRHSPRRRTRHDACRRRDASTVERCAWCVPTAAAPGSRRDPSAFDGVRALDGAYLEHALADHGDDAGAIDVSYQHGVQNVIDSDGRRSRRRGGV